MRRCCVIIPYFEDPIGLNQSVESLKVEAEVADVVIVDDGSVRWPARCVVNLRDSDNIRIIELRENRGIETALNVGVARVRAEYEYFARLDAGDICRPGRLGKQATFLDENPEVGIVGGWVSFSTPEREHLYTLKHPITDVGIRRAMHINSAFTHPAVMLRESALPAGEKVYRSEYPAAEDYDLFFRILRSSQGANLAEVVVDCLISADGISNKRRRVQVLSRIRLMVSNFRWRPAAVYGLVKAVLLLLTPRSFTVAMNRARERVHHLEAWGG